MVKFLPTLAHPRLSQKEREFRSEAVDQARKMSLETGYVLSDRLEALCVEFIAGKLSDDEFRNEIVRPYLN